MKPPYALGAYIGNPNGSDATSEAQFESNYASFASTMGAAPVYLDNYVDQNQTIDQWVGNAGWQAWSDAQSQDAKGMTPVIGLPMASLADSSISQDQYFKNFAAGDYDSMLQGVVQQYAQNGFTTQVWRPGWEMNLPDTVNYAEGSAQTAADYVAAFQHIYTVLHAAGQAQGVDISVVWNPGINNDNPTTGNPLTSLYPGDAYVDVIGADVYSDAHPYGNASDMYDWDKSGQVYNSANPVYDTSLAQWASDPVNLEHYYADPASQQWAADGSANTALSLQDLLEFARANGKPVGIAETGAGATGDGANVPDNPTFVNWLSQTLQQSDVPISFVNVWDSNGGGNYEFSSASDSKPQEAAAWAQDFGSPANATDPVTGAAVGSETTYSPEPTVAIGSGSSVLNLDISEDAYLGDAQFTLSVDGVQVGGTQTAVASHSASLDQDFQVKGGWGAGVHTVAVDFLNDAYGSSQTQDRNLYVDAATYNGIWSTDAEVSLKSSGSQSFLVGLAPPSLGTQTPDQRLSSGQTFSFALPMDTFTDTDGGQLTYSARQENGTALPSWLSFDAQTDTFSGTAPASGAAQPVVVVVSSSDGTSAAEEFHVYAPGASPVLQHQSPDQRMGAGQSFSFSLPAGSYSDPSGGTVSYAAQQANGAALPSWVSFDAQRDTFSGTTPLTASNVDLEVIAMSSNGGLAAEAFHIYSSAPTPVLQHQAPDQRLAAGAAFSFTLPSNSYGSPDNAQISYAAEQTSLAALPSWIGFDARTGVFSGTTPTTPSGSSSAALGVRIDATEAGGGSAAEAFHIYTH